MGVREQYRFTLPKPWERGDTFKNCSIHSKTIKGALSSDRGNEDKKVSRLHSHM